MKVRQAEARLSISYPFQQFLYSALLACKRNLRGGGAL